MNKKKKYKIHPNSLKNLKLPKDYSFTQDPQYQNKMSKIMKGRKVNQKTLDAMKPFQYKKGESKWKGKKRGPMSQEHKDKVSLGKKGQIPWNRGQSMSKEQIQKLKNAWANPETRNLHLIAVSKMTIKTKNTKPERMMQIALALNGIKFEKHKPIIGQPDIFIEPNICIFVDGDYPHANPKKYNADDLIWGRTASQRWARDIFVNNELSKLGYVIIRLWESDIKTNTQGCAENIIKMIKERMEIQKI